MKQLFTGKKKKEKERIAREENVRSRYADYRGGREEIEPKSKRVEANELNSVSDINRTLYSVDLINHYNAQN